MKNLKFSFFFILIAQYCFSCSLKQYTYGQLTTNKKPELTSSRQIKDNQNNELPLIKRKYRSKGIKVIVPYISRITIQQFFTPCTFITPAGSNIRFSSLQNVESKRGPPLN